MRGLNSRPLACEASVITTTPTRPVMALKPLLINFTSINKHANPQFPLPLPTADGTHKRMNVRSEPKASASQYSPFSYHCTRQHNAVTQNGSAILVEPVLHPPAQRVRVSLLPQQIESHPRPRHQHQHVPKLHQHLQLLRLLLLLHYLDRPPQRLQRNHQGPHIDGRCKSIQNASHVVGRVKVAHQRHEE